MPDMPRTKFNSPWTVENIETELNGTKNARGNLTMTEKLAQKVETSTYATDKAALDAEIAAVANAGAKNLLHFDAIGSGISVYGNTYTHNGITYTLNADMTVTATGTADSSSNSYAYLILNGSFAPIDDYCDGKHIVSGCPANGSTSKYRMYIAKSGWGSLNETGIGAIIPDKGNYTGLLIACFVSKGYAIPAGEPLVFKPMIRPAAITDPTYEPYALSNTVITPALIKQVDEGSKNIANWSADTQTINNVKFVVEDGTVTVSLTSGTTATARSQKILSVVFQDDLESGTYVLSGAPNVTSGGLYLWDSTAGTRVTPTSDTGNGTVFTFDYDKTHKYNLTVDVANGYSIPSGTTLVYKPMICTKADWDISHKYVPYRLPYQEISDTVQALKKAHHYGFIIDKNNSDSYTAVSYTHGAVGFSPAYMDYTNNKFVYGSWADAWFIRDAVPVALNFDGTEAFELDKSDFTKKADGTASGIDCISMVLTDSQPSDWATNWKWYYTKSGDYYVGITESSAPTWAANTYYRAVSAIDANFMLRMPKVYFKRSNDDGHNYIEISDRQLDSDFHAYAHIDANGTEKEYIYLPLFKGSMINGKLRSVPNVWPQNLSTAQQEIDATTALGTGWQIWDHSSRELINDLLILISKSLDSQTSFGKGRESGYVDDANQNYGFLKTGALMDKGMFYGYSSSTAEVKVFGMESFWANRWDRMLGLILKDNVWKVKMQPSYNFTADGYATLSGVSTPSVNVYFKSVHSSEYGSVPAVDGGEPSKYYRDYFYKSSSGTRVALVGGICSNGDRGGFRCVGVHFVASYSSWYIGASPVYK